MRPLFFFFPDGWQAILSVMLYRYRFIVLFTALLLSACAPGLPTSEKLEQIRLAKQESLARDMAAHNFELGQPVFLRIFKQEKILESWVQNPDTGRYEPFKTYPICKYSGQLGPKLMEGDRQAPEGFYTVGAAQMNPWSEHHLSFDIGFPNAYDRAQGRSGSHLMIHGGCKSDGCYAMRDGAMEELYLLVEASIGSGASGANVPVHIFPFRMTPRATSDKRGHEWFPFWKNLKEGYDAFELTRVPPKIRVRSGHHSAKYVIENTAAPRVASVL